MTVRCFRLVALFLLVLAGACSGGDGDQPPTTTTTEAGLSTRQVASLVAEHGDPLVEALEQHQSCDSIECLFGTARQSRYQKMVDLAETLENKLPASIRVAPEIDDLTDRSHAALRRVDKAWGDWQLCLAQNKQADGSSDSTKCGPQESEIEASVVAVRDVLRGWEPYR